MHMLVPVLQDPGNLESDLQVGANAGYALLWVLLWCTVLVSELDTAFLACVVSYQQCMHTYTLSVRTSICSWLTN